MEVISCRGNKKSISIPVISAAVIREGLMQIK